MDEKIGLMVVVGTLFFILIFNKTMLVKFIGTFIHEFGHVFATWLVFERVIKINMSFTMWGVKKNESYGYMSSTASGRFKRSFVAFWGYIFPPLLLLGFTWLLINDYSVYALGIMYGIFLYYIIKASYFWQSFILTVIVSVAIYGFYYYETSYDYLLIIILTFLAFSSLKSIFEIWSLRTQNNAWDAYIIKSSLLIPHFVTIGIWYVIIFVSVGLTLYLIFY